MMDLDIIKIILQNSNDESLNIDSTCLREPDDPDQCQVVNPHVISALAKSITRILCHKVSPAAHQRYLVRTKIIEQLRDWSRITHRYSHLQFFTDSVKTSKFTRTLLDQHVTEEFVSSQTSVKSLIPLSYTIIAMQPFDTMLAYKLQLLVKKIISLDKTAESDQFLDILSDKYHDICLTLPTIESLYATRTSKLLEEPLIDSFVSFSSKHMGKHCHSKLSESSIAFDESNFTGSSEKLLEYSSKSAQIFQLLSSVLKEVFNNTNCSKVVLDFTQCVLKRISQLCKGATLTMLDLYPRKLQCLVLLLRIQPSLHTTSSKNYTIQLLKDVNSSKRQDLLILLIHFPTWIQEYAKHVSNEVEL